MIDPPRTIAEAGAYRYFKWAGNPQGTVYQQHRCAWEVWDNSRFHQCIYKRRTGPDNLYCGVHAKKVPVSNPEYKAIKPA